MKNGVLLPRFFVSGIFFKQNKNTTFMKLSGKLNDDIKVIKKRLDSDDVEYIDLKIADKNAVLIFIKD